MRQATLVYCLRGDELLLGLKKKGFGAGKWNGFGGKVEQGEGVLAAAARELLEECGLSAAHEEIDEMARIDFFFGDKGVFECHAFSVRQWRGEPRESDEMSPGWWPLGKLPWERMWPSDKYWLPRALAGERLSAVCRFDAAGERVEAFSFVPRVVVLPTG